MHRTLIFFLLDSGRTEPIERSEYVRLLGGDIRLRKYANQTVRVADWYVEVRDGRAVSLANETYSLLRLDGTGRVRWPHERSGERANHAFYAALTRSTCPDPDDDPVVRRLRGELRTEYAWRPSDAERRALQALVFPAASSEA